jgi:hypothetical protein
MTLDTIALVTNQSYIYAYVFVCKLCIYACVIVNVYKIVQLYLLINDMTVLNCKLTFKPRSAHNTGYEKPNSRPDISLLQH